MYKSTKMIEGFSTCFRQFAATDTHCKYLHGYAIKFKITFRADSLDDRNWVQDFGFLSRSNFKIDGILLKDWFKYMFDHTVILSREDPFVNDFMSLDIQKSLRLRLLDKVGCEAFSELVFNVLSLSVKNDGGRVIVESVECFENENNSALFVNPKFE